MLVNGIKKVLCVYLITLYSVVMAAEKQIDAKKMCESVVERIGSAVGPLTHTCQGNETKASCVVTSPIQIDTTLSIKNFKCEIVSDAKDITASLSGNPLWILKPQDSSMHDFMPNKFTCNLNLKLHDVLLNSVFGCMLYAPIYSFKADGDSDLQSALFKEKDINNIYEISLMDKTSSTQNDIAINPKQTIFELQGAKFGEGVFKKMKKDDPTLTQEQYVATINMGLAMSQVALTQNQNLSKETISGIMKAAGAVGDILLSKKQNVKITLKRKSSEMFTMKEFFNIIDQLDTNPQVLLQYLNNYDIITVVR